MYITAPAGSSIGWSKLKDDGIELTSDVIEAAKNYAATLFKTDSSGHDFFHTMRVYRMAGYIAKKEHADLSIVALAALLHDVDDRKLSPETYAHKDRAVSFMRTHHLSAALCRSICAIIEEVSYMGTGSVVPSSIEGQCVQDADRLDALGAIGVARVFAYSGSRNRLLHDPEIKPLLNMNKEVYQNHTSTAINHFYEKLFYLKDMMNTDTAKRIAQRREQYMKHFVSAFLSEWDMTDFAEIELLNVKE